MPLKSRRDQFDSNCPPKIQYRHNAVELMSAFLQFQPGKTHPSLTTDPTARDTRLTKCRSKDGEDHGNVETVRLQSDIGMVLALRIDNPNDPNSPCQLEIVFEEEEQRESITEGKLIVDVKIQTLPEADFLKNNVSLYFETPHLMFKYHYVHVDETRNPPAPDLLHSKIPRDCRQFTELPAANGHNMS